jgi:hypothetical protein
MALLLSPGKNFLNAHNTRLATSPFCAWLIVDNSSGLIASIRVTGIRLIRDKKPNEELAS